MSKSTNSYQLITRYLDDSANESQMLELNQRLQQDPEIQDQLIDLAIQTYSIHSESSELKIQTPFPLKKILVLAACVTLLFGIYLSTRTSDTASPFVVRVTNITGEVTLPEDNLLWSGGHIKTIGEQSSLDLEFSDGTKLRLAEKTTASISTSGQKHIRILNGAAYLDVVKQPIGAPLILTTPSAELTVLGTHFNVFSKNFKTQLEVGHGAVEFKQLHDGQSVLVEAGEFSIAGNKIGSFGSMNIPEVPPTWSLDFRYDGFSKMRIGNPEQNAVGETIGIRSHRSTKGYDVIRSQKSWDHGDYAWFKITKGRTLKVRYKMDHPAWFNFIIVCRSPDLRSMDHSRLLYQDVNWWRGLKPGEWRTIEIPLDQPKDSKQQGLDIPTPLNWNALDFSFSAGAEERGFVIERMWID